MSSKFGSASPAEIGSKFGSAKATDIPEFEREALDPSMGMSAGEAFLVGTGKGLTSAGRGVRALWNWATGDDEEYNQIIAEQKESRQLLSPLKERYPLSIGAGELTGEIAGTLPFGGIAGAGAKQLAAKKLGQYGSGIAGGIGAGLTEGAIIGAPEEQAIGGGVIGAAAGGISEAILPPVFNKLRKVWQGLTRTELDRNLIRNEAGELVPTPEFQQQLDARGVDWNQLTNDAMREIEVGSAEEAANLALFRSQGIDPAGQSRISGDLGLSEAQQLENWMLRKTNDPDADLVRQKFLDEQKQIEDRFRQVAADLGVPEEAGDTLKTAIQSQKSALASARRSAYDELGEIAQEAGMDLPIARDGILSGVRVASDYPIDPAVETSIAKALKEFGFAPDVDVGESLLSKMLGKPQENPLTVASLETFRQRINKAFLGKDDAAHKAAREKIISAIDNELDVLADLEGTSGNISKLRDQAQLARSLRRREAVEFNDKDIIESLTGLKKGSASTPLIDAAEVIPKIRSLKKEGEFRKLVNTLEEGDELSKEALGNLQAAIVIDLLEGSMQKSRVIGSERLPLISGTSLSKSMDKFGRNKLDYLFRSNPEALKTLKQLEQINKRRVTNLGNVQMGSVPPHLVNKLWASLSSAASSPRLPRAVGAPAEALIPDPYSGAARTARTVAPTRSELEDFILLNSPRLSKVLMEGARQTPAVAASSEATEREY